MFPIKYDSLIEAVQSKLNSYNPAINVSTNGLDNLALSDTNKTFIYKEVSIT